MSLEFVPLPEPEFTPEQLVALLPQWRDEVSDPALPLETRLETLKTLLLYDGSDATALWLSELVGDESAEIPLRGAAALSLGKFSAGEAFERLLEHRRVADPVVRQYVVEALASTGKPEAVAALIEALSDPDNQVFSAAAEGLGSIGREAAPLLTEALTHASSDVRCIAAWQLGEMGAIVAIPALVEQVRTGDNVEVQALCLWALGEIGEARPEVLEVVRWAKDQEAPEIRLRAETALKKIVRHIN